MWWERWIPESYLTKSAICGVECFLEENILSYHYCILEIKKNNIVISQEGTTHEISDVLKAAKKYSAPITLALTGKGIITKKIIFNENDSLKLSDLVRQHLPAIAINEFYTQFYKNETNSGYITVCRKEQVTDILKQFKDSKVEVINVFIGPLVCNVLHTIIFAYNRLTTSNNQLELENGFVNSVLPLSSDDIVRLSINGLSVRPQQTISFAAGFSYLTKQEPYLSDNIEITNLPINHLEKIKIKLVLCVLIAILFIISSVNSVLFFQKYEENSALEVELNLYESKNAQITRLLESYQKKKNLIEQAGIFDNKKVSEYADKIAASLPEEIILRELYFNPEVGETEEDSLMDFKQNQLIIKGNCNKSLLLNDWVNVLKSQSFVKSVNLENFVFNSEGHLPNFVLKLETE